MTVGILEAGTYRPGDALILTPGATGPAVLGTESGTGSQLQGNASYDWMFNTEVTVLSERFHVRIDDARSRKLDWTVLSSVTRVEGSLADLVPLTLW